jgi:hypothetical protein
MGEARRRKQAGTYPQQDDPLVALRRSWCGRDRIAAEDFVAPEGVVALTLDVERVNATTFVFDAAAIVAALDRVADIARSLTYHELVRLIARSFAEAKQISDETAFNWIGIAGLWTAFNHPQSGDLMRKAVSDSLRQNGKAHISWHVGPSGFAVALADKFVDLDHVAALAPQDRVTTQEAPETGPKPPMH